MAVLLCIRNSTRFCLKHVVSTIVQRIPHPRIPIMTKYLGLMLLITLFSGCDLCNCTRVAQHTIPHERLCVIVYDCDCGATTGFARRVALRQCADVPKQPRDDRGEICVLDGQVPTQVHWDGTRTIIIQTDLVKRIRYIDSFSGYEIRYVQTPPGPDMPPSEQ